MHTVEQYAGTQTRKIRLILFSLVVLLLLDLTSAVRWIGIYREENIANTTNICKRMREDYKLTWQQMKYCKTMKDSMIYVHEAARLTVYTCQNLFRYRRWNCSSIRQLPKVPPDLIGGTKEREFVNALSAAALTYTIARGCASSSTFNCSCSPHPGDPPNGNFKWGGCGDNVQWGSKFSRRFIDTHHKQSEKFRNSKYYDFTNTDVNEDDDHDDINYNKNLSYYIRRHNNEIGRKVVVDSLITHCKCHGVSGSCSVKTCWKGLPLKFSDIGEQLVNKYNTAVSVHPLSMPEQTARRFTYLSSLLYAVKSPDYCEYNPAAGSYGTSGRECNSSAITGESCEHMCCSRGYKSHFIELSERCNCKYHWCCYVTCDICQTKRKANICN